MCIFVLFHLMLLLCCTLLSCLLFFFLYPLISGPLSCKSYNHHPFIFLPLQTILHPTTSIQILMTHYLHIAAFKFHLTLRTSSYTQLLQQLLTCMPLQICCKISSLLPRKPIIYPCCSPFNASDCVRIKLIYFLHSWP